jgi:pyridoxal biosynthesis lyase PdxS
MVLEQWAQIAEIVGAVAVVISLVYLATQIRQANVVARTQARQSWMHWRRANCTT